MPRSCGFRPRSFSPTLENYQALITGKLETSSGVLEINFMRNLANSLFLSTTSVALGLIPGVPAAYAFARLKFRGSGDIAFTLLSFRFAPPLLVLLPLTIYFQQLGLSNTYVGLIWVYQLIVLPLILWIVRGYFEDIPPMSNTPIASPGTASGPPSARSRCSGDAGHRGGGLLALSSPGTTSSSHWCWPRPTSSR